MTIDFKYDETKYVNAYRYIGSFNNLENVQNPKSGDICVINDKTYLYYDKWNCLTRDDTYNAIKDKPIKLTKCTQCNAMLPLNKVKDGICQCEYCNSWNYVY